MRYTNIIVIKDIIISKKAREIVLSKDPSYIIALVEVAQALNPVHFAWRYRQKMSNVDMYAANKLRLTADKKYWKRADQFEIELSWLYDWIPVLVIFVRHS